MTVDVEPDEPPVDPKDAAILRSAFVAFARYGLRRTSMADIAKGAGMSRPALYLRYAGKDDIFNAMIRVHFERSEKAVERVLAAKGPPSEVLLATLHAFDGDAMEEIMNSPHADEFLSANAPFSQAAVQDAHERITGHITRWIAAGVAEGRLSLGGLGATAEEVAATFMAAKFGIKAVSRDFASYRAAEARVAAVFGKALGG